MDKCIGIVGGAGPMAGLLLAQKVISYYQKRYGAIHDRDFPKLILYSYPFSEMLKGQSYNVQLELEKALRFLEEAGCEKKVIACNTLHCFLGGEKPIHLVKETEEYIRQKRLEKVLVLCTSTSASNKLYQGTYLAESDQQWLDAFIDTVLSGNYSAQNLVEFIRNKSKNFDGVVLGCSELSVALEGYVLDKIIDPIEIILERLCT